MLWLGAQDKPQVSIHLYSPQITITNGSNSNLLIGYVSVEVSRPTVVKSLMISFSGIYTAYWINGTGHNRQEYYQNKRFHHDTCKLTSKNLQHNEVHAGNRVSDRWDNPDYEQNGLDGFGRSRSNSTSSGYLSSVFSMQETSGSSRHQQANQGTRQMTTGLEEPVNEQDDVEDSLRMFSFSTPAFASPPPPPPHPTPPKTPAFSTIDDANDLISGIELAAGTHRFEFFFPLPPKLPSTILSEVGGIEYDLVVQMKSKSMQSRMPSTCVRTARPVHVINLPSRFALLQTDLPVSDGAVFTRQIDESWWVLARLSSGTASPGDVLKLNVSLSWPEKCPYEEDPSRFVSVVAVKMDLYECTVCKSLKTGAVIKKIESTIASSIGHGATEDSDDYCNSTRGINPAEGFLNERGSSAMDLYSMGGSTAVTSAKTSRAPSPVNGERQPVESRARRGMFNQSFKRIFELQVPSQKQTIGKLQAGGVHIDCRSAPLSVIHEVRILLQVLDLTTQKLYSIPFHTRLIVVPEAESFLLPAYSLSSLDIRVM
ncbi:hypothetical protein LPJ64_005109 [Coemansia asiatica]|uniref:Arrestin-like N-terminal domain-containing protein n=1 Tax=Coemansia asiatica TaxID=1052880 RepID=A0A9W8CIG6_9FUNG|nr:hypothetical protein LPJ64_005109 [Coemansia asiatica]